MQKMERRFLQLLLLLLDVLGLSVAFLLAQMIRFSNVDTYRFFEILIGDYRYYGILSILIFANYIFDLYEPRHWRSQLFSPLKIAFATMTVLISTFAWLYFLSTEKAGLVGRGVFLGAMSGYFVYSLVFRYLVNKRTQKQESRRQWLFVGSAASFQILQKDLKRIKAEGFIEWVDNEKVEGEIAQLRDKLQSSWSAIIVDGQLGKETTRLLMHSRISGQVVLGLQSFYEFYCGKIPVHSLDDSWFAFTEGFSIIHSQTSNRLKRFSDILISAGMLIVFSPIMLVCAILIKLGSRGPALFSQVRVGQNGNPFVMWKFRSMRLDAEKDGPQYASLKDKRITLVGQVMRKTRLDELPQLWNILIGDMSFIGPRPERPEFVDYLVLKIPFYEFRHLVKPGLTGWAQVLYPYGASDEDTLEKLQYDLFYIKNYSFELDIEIIFKTISVVVFGAGR